MSWVTRYGEDVTSSIAKFHTPEIIVGRGALGEVPRTAAALGMRRLMIVSDRTIEQTPWYDELVDQLTRAGLQAVSYLDVSPNPRAQEISAAHERYHDGGCDGIAALGGGSVIDAAKGVAIVAANGGHILQYEGIDRAVSPLPPLVAAPTTAGSGADVSQFCIVSDVKRRTKVTIIGRSLVPDVSVIDPRVLATVTPQVTAQCGMDVITHCIEAYTSVAHNRLTDSHALQSISTVWSALERLVDDPANVTAGDDMAFASMEAGMAFTNAILGAAHAMSHPVGGLCDAPHGAINAVVLPHIIRFNAETDAEPYLDLAAAIGISPAATARGTADLLAAEVAAMARRVELPDSLVSLGVRPDDVELLARHALADACMTTNPRQPTLVQVENLYRAAL
ncbi:iron-containing alcohol dehydrogenase [Gordonia sp. CPCC 205333]|uniref:iron-containing alcohol dehydrogenase n=1 Tax=Gordonia sp. CPCC 205333 TaxID=3140790 RepID=UPI003AF3CECE